MAADTGTSDSVASLTGLRVDKTVISRAGSVGRWIRADRPEKFARRFAVFPVSVWLVFIAVVAFATYANSLGNYFLIDDFWHLDKAAHTSWSQVLQPWQYSGEDFKSYWFNEQRLQKVRGEGFFRPVVTIIYKSAAEVFGTEPIGYHVINLLLHVGASLAAFVVARLFFAHLWVAGAVGLLFATHPSHAETVQWVAANADASAGCFFLTAFASYGWWLRQRRPWQYGLALFGFILALGSKEVGIMLPSVLVVFECYRHWHHDRRWPAWRSMIRHHATFWLLTAAYLLMHYRAFSGIAEMNKGGQYMHSPFSPTFVPFVLFNLTYELLHLLVPFPLFPIDPKELMQVFGVFPVTLICVVLLGVMFFGTHRLLRNWRGWSFFPVFAILTLAPTFPILVAQRFLYLPSFGFCLLLGAILELAAESRWFERRWSCMANSGWVFAAVATLAGAYAMISISLNFMWSFPSNHVRKQIAAIEQELPKLPPGTTVCLVNLWPPAFGMEFMLPLRYHAPSLNVQVLSIYPKILPLNSLTPAGPLVEFFAQCLPDHMGIASTTVRWENTGVLRVSIDGGRYMRSLVEELYPASASIQKNGAVVTTAAFKAEVVRADADGVQEMCFRFAKDRPPPVVLDLRDARVRRIE